MSKHAKACWIVASPFILAFLVGLGLTSFAGLVILAVLAGVCLAFWGIAWLVVVCVAWVESKL